MENNFKINITKEFRDYLNSLNPEFIEETKDFEPLEKIIYSLIDSKYGSVERQFLPFPISRKFFEIMKLSVKYLIKENSKTKLQNMSMLCRSLLPLNRIRRSRD